MKNLDHILNTKPLNFQMSNFNVFFQMVLVYYGITLRRPREQFLQNHKTQIHAVSFKDTLTIVDENLFKACRSVLSSVPLSHYKRGTPTMYKNFTLLSQISHSLLQGFFSFLTYMYWTTRRFPCVSIKRGFFLIIFLFFK